MTRASSAGVSQGDGHAPDAPRGPRRGGDRRGRRGRRRGRRIARRPLHAPARNRRARETGPTAAPPHDSLPSRAAPPPRPRVYRSVGTARARSRHQTRQGRRARGCVLCTAARAHALTPPRVSTHGRPTHAGEPGPWQPVNAHTDDVASSGHGTAREWAAWYRCAFALRGEVCRFRKTLSLTRASRSQQSAHSVHTPPSRSVCRSHRSLDRMGGETRAVPCGCRFAPPSPARAPDGGSTPAVAPRAFGSRAVRATRARARVRDGTLFRVGRTALSPVDDPALNDLLLAWYYRWGRRRAPRARRSRSRGARCVMPRRPPRSGYYTGRYHALQEARRS